MALYSGRESNCIKHCLSDGIPKRKGVRSGGSRLTGSRPRQEIKGPNEPLWFCHRGSFEVSATQPRGAECEITGPCRMRVRLPAKRFNVRPPVRLRQIVYAHVVSCRGHVDCSIQTCTAATAHIFGSWCEWL